MEENRKYSLKELITDIKMDVGRESGPSVLCALYYFLFHPSVKVLFYYRLSHWLRVHGLRKLAYAVKDFQSHYGCYISQTSVIGKNLNLPHPVGIVIGDHVVIEDDVSIYQNVTLGSHGKEGEPLAYPHICKGVKIFAGAVLIGNIKVGEYATVGANSVVLSDIPPYSTAVGVPYKKSNQLNSLGMPK